MSVSVWVFTCVCTHHGKCTYTWQHTCVLDLWLCMSVCVLVWLCACLSHCEDLGVKRDSLQADSPRRELFGGQILPRCKASRWQSGVRGWSCQVFLVLPICLFLPFTAPALILSPYRRLFLCHLACLESAMSVASPILSLLSEVIAHEKFLTSKKKGDLIIHCNPNRLKFF